LPIPPWPFQNATGKIAPQHRRLWRYSVMSLSEIMALPVAQFAATHLYLWCPNALLPDGLAVMRAWGFTYKSNIVWFKVRKRRRPRRSRRRLLFPQRDRASLVRRARQERSHARTGAAAS
jgi:N6-adenosine-specific RNA methylase IME4